MAPSSNGLGQRVFNPLMGVRFPLGLPLDSHLQCSLVVSGLRPTTILHRANRVPRAKPRGYTRCVSYYFYLARCADGSLYSGSCINVLAREARHNEGKGAKYTRSRRPVKVIYHEVFALLVEARRREAQVKTWSKAKKENLAAGKHPIEG